MATDADGAAARRRGRDRGSRDALLRGIKLGTGGLARACSSSVQLALEMMPRAERVDWAELTNIIGYASIAAAQQLLPRHEAQLLAEEYGADVRLQVRAPLPHIGALRAALADVTRGQAVVTGAGE